MPVTIQPASLKYKNGNTFQAVDCLKGDNTDVQINGTSITSNGVANIPTGQYSLGVVTQGGQGVVVGPTGILKLQTSTASQVKQGEHFYSAICPASQHQAAFYGLAKAAGDTTQALSDNAVGVYTEGAKSSIRSMLGLATGVVLTEHIASTTPTIECLPNVRYYCDEISTITIVPPDFGTCDVIFCSGSTPTVLTVSSSSGAVMFPAWFDPEDLESDTIYEIMITDGLYGSVMTWPIPYSVVK